MIRFYIKSVRLCEFPFTTRVDSVTCMLWFKPALNLSVAQKEANEDKCPPCKRLLHHLNWQKREQSPNVQVGGLNVKIHLQEPDCSTCLQMASKNVKS